MATGKPAKEIVIRNSASIKWRNELIEAQYDLSLLEMRLVVALSAFIAKNSNEFCECVVPAADIADFIGLDGDSHSRYEKLYRLCDLLLGRTLKFRWREPDAMFDSWTVRHWFERVSFDGRTHTLTWRFSDDMKPVLLQVKEAYTRLEAKKLMAFKCKYSNRFYLLLTEWEHQGDKAGTLVEYDVLIKPLRELFEIGEKYKTISDFVRFVITPAVEEINALTDYEITATPHRSGHAYRHIHFTIGHKTEQQKREQKYTAKPVPVSAVPLPQQQTTPQQQEIDDKGRRGKIPPDVQEWLDGMKKKKPFERTTEKPQNTFSDANRRP